MMSVPAALLLDAPTALYLVWVAFTLALIVVACVWFFRPALGGRPLRRLALGWLVLTLVVGFVSFHVFGRASYLGSTPMAPDFSLQTVDGASFSRDGLHGKVVLIEFWASWCGPCREALPEMLRLHQEFKDPRFLMIGVSEDEDQSKFEAFVAQHGIRWPQDWDPKGELLSRFSSNAIPSYALIGPDGRLRFMQKGYTPDTYLRLREAIGDALGNRNRNRIASVRP